MIGIVVVSHSRALACAAVDLATAMTGAGPRPAIEVAAGLDDGSFGTDATAVAAAITGADSGDGVLVLLDLGSAVLSAEFAVDLAGLPSERVRLSPAPLVEGLLAAVVTAGAGAGLDAVAAEAENALAPKQFHLGSGQPPVPAETVVPVETAVPGETAETAERIETVGRASTGRDRPGEAPGAADASSIVRVASAHGLHARPAAMLVALVATFDAEVWIANPDRGRPPASADSPLALAGLDARAEDRLIITGSGRQAVQAVGAVTEFVASGFDPQVRPTPGR